MTFKESVKSVMLTNYTTMSGRASRSEYWWFILFYLLASFVLGIIYAIVGSFMFGSEVILSKKFGLITTIITVLIFLMPSISVSVRRFADAGRGFNEAIIVYIVAFVSSLTIPLFGVDPMIDTKPPVSSILSGCFIVSMLYTLYISTKKSID